MDFSNDLDDYEKNVQNILNNGFKMLIDNVNETLSQLLQSTILSAENVENGLKREFQALIGNISNTQTLDELNAAIPSAEIEEDQPFISSDEVLPDTLFQYQDLVGSVSPELNDGNNNGRFKKEVPFISNDDEYNLDSKYFAPKNNEVKSKPNRASPVIKKPETNNETKVNNFKVIEPKPVNNVVNTPPIQTKTIHPQISQEQQEAREKQIMEERQRKMAEMEKRKRNFEKLDESGAKKANQYAWECDQCNYKIDKEWLLKRHVTNMARNGLHVKSHDCEECGATFEWKKGLDEHTKTKHRSS